jgi:peptidoglycan/xylan/chitin deacetylase (PgdA/CDA1 family)
MIGVLFDAAEAAAVAELFQLFKTPWEPYSAEHRYDVVISSIYREVEIKAQLSIIFGSKSYPSDPTPAKKLFHRTISPGVLEGKKLPVYGELIAFEDSEAVKSCVRADEHTVGFRCEVDGHNILRLGYDLFKEVQHLLSHKQPLENARIPTLDLHIDALRRWLLEAQISFVEIPPTPAGTSFIVCLTHDIDFVGIRNHRFDHTMLGFLFRGTFGAFRNLIRGRIGLRRLLRSWAAVGSLPLIYLGWSKDFWLPFEWYLRVEKHLGGTYYLIPFKGRGGSKIPARAASRRAAAYDISDLSDWIRRLQEAGCEIGVHGIDAWHDVDQATEENKRVSAISGAYNPGMRMHWLLCDKNTPRVLDEAGYDYDSTAGYNEEVGYHSGTNQVYQPPGTQHLLELPLHIQDGALFFPQRLDLSEASALELCAVIITHAREHGGVLTTLWHDRSFGPERFWGEVYVQLIAMLKQSQPWFATGREAVDWFRARRSVRFERHISAENTEEVVARCGNTTPSRAFTIKVHRPGRDQSTLHASGSPQHRSWSGTTDARLSPLLRQNGSENPVNEELEENPSGSLTPHTLTEVLPVIR